MNTLSSVDVERLKEIGSYLRQKRLEKSLSLEEVSASTHIRLKLLEALEAGEGKELPEIIYVRAFIRHYSELLQVDGEALVQKLSQNPNSTSSSPAAPKTVVSAKNTASKNSASFPLRSRVRGFKLSWLLYLLVLAGAVYGLFYALSQSSRSPSSVPSARVPQSTPVTKPSSPTAVVKPAGSNSQPKPSPSPAVKPATSNPQPKPSPVAAKPTPLAVTVKLEGSSWLKVQADGKTLYEGILKKGEQKTWTGAKQITLRSGNAGAVKWSKDKKSFQPIGRLGEVKEVIVK